MEKAAGISRDAEQRDTIMELLKGLKPASPTTTDNFVTPDFQKNNQSSAVIQ